MDSSKESLHICGLESLSMVQLRTMPPFVTMHTFCVSWDIQVSKEFGHQYNNIFARFMATVFTSGKSRS